NRLANRFRIGGVVLVALDVCLHVLRRHQPHLMPKRMELARPVFFPHELLQPLSVRHLESAALALPLVERRAWKARACAKRRTVFACSCKILMICSSFNSLFTLIQRTTRVCDLNVRQGPQLGSVTDPCLRIP